jgi:hypothetical protein
MTEESRFYSRQGRGIFLFSTVPRPALVHTQPPIQLIAGRESDHSPPSSAEAKNGAMPPLPLTSSWRDN